jgi:hypothetical protein
MTRGIVQGFARDSIGFSGKLCLLKNQRPLQRHFPIQVMPIFFAT